jgi:hypothetical protein
MNGAAIALAFATVYYNLVRYLVVLFKLGMQPFSFDLAKIIITSCIIGLIISYLPKISGNKLMTTLDMGYRSIILTIIYGSVIYWSNISPELNGAMKNLWLKVTKILGYL